MNAHLGGDCEDAKKVTDDEDVCANPLQIEGFFRYAGYQGINCLREHYQIESKEPYVVEDQTLYPFHVPFRHRRKEWKPYFLRIRKKTRGPRVQGPPPSSPLALTIHGSLSSTERNPHWITELRTNDSAEPWMSSYPLTVGSLTGKYIRFASA